MRARKGPRVNGKTESAEATRYATSGPITASMVAFIPRCLYPMTILRVFGPIEVEKANDGEVEENTAVLAAPACLPRKAIRASVLPAAKSRLKLCRP